MKTSDHPPVSTARVGDVLVAVRHGVDSVRAVQVAIMDLVRAVAREPGVRGCLALVDAAITERRLLEEWTLTKAVLQEGLLGRVWICLVSDGQVRGIGQEPPPDVVEVVRSVTEEKAAPAHVRTDYWFVISKILIHNWLTTRTPVTSEWIQRTAGCSYPTVARTLKELGGIVQRGSDRRVMLKFLPEDEIARLAAAADRARSTLRFADRSGQPRSTEALVRRLGRMGVKGVAIGGVLGARHYVPELNLIGTPRLDLSVHAPKKAPDLSFLAELDPALVRETDPLAPAQVVVHAVRHADSLFEPRAEGLAWADRVECLLDLHEARLESQARDFLRVLKQRSDP